MREALAWHDETNWAVQCSIALGEHDRGRTRPGGLGGPFAERHAHITCMPAVGEIRGGIGTAKAPFVQMSKPLASAASYPIAR